MIARLFLLSLILFGLELGVFLVVLPWSPLWERNYFLFRYPGLAPWLLDNHLRGVISGLGLVDIGLALWYASHFRQVLEQWLAGPALSASVGAAESLNRGSTA